MYKALCKNKFLCWDGILSRGGQFTEAMTFGKVNVAVFLLNGDQDKPDYFMESCPPKCGHPHLMWGTCLL